MTSDLAKILKSKYKSSYLGSKLPELERCSSGLLSLDILLDGGLPRGRILQLYGPPSAGKTTLCYTIMRAFQKRDEPVVFIDMERTAQANDFTRNRIRESNDFHFLQPGDGEEALSAAVDAANAGAKLVVLDSVPYLRPKAVVEKEIGERSFAATASLISNASSQLVTSFSNNQAILLLVNQLRANTSSYGSPEKPSGGTTLQYLVTLSLSIRRKETLPNNEGIVSRLTVDKSKVSEAYQEALLEIHFDSGVSEMADLRSCLVKLGLVIRKGAWYEFEAGVANVLGIDAKIGQGEVSVGKLLQERPDLAEKLHAMAIQKAQEPAE